MLSNPLYTNPDRVLLPPLSQLLRNVTIWSDFFLRWSTAPSVAPIPLQLSQHLYADGLYVVFRVDVVIISVIHHRLALSFHFYLRCRPLHADELYDENEVLVDSQGTALATSADFEVPAAVTSSDCWEAAFRVERMKRISAEVRKERTIRTQQVNTLNFPSELPGISG